MLITAFMFISVQYLGVQMVAAVPCNVGTRCLGDNAFSSVSCWMVGDRDRMSLC